ncbi:thioredoxin [Enemella evansiae]|uniref:Thioredoxin n=1 Tax=Enemella evansiae TaxID=2016499 RepID=A0A255GPX3_9ACTN|nr:thioredoxin [Enemella evansiae]PFG69200.1 thioredoxin [Propionibacteriaceae bacterium ES.041]OYN96771.1 thioredoxin [Enemella evansiae]OYO00829.1 thioredoxin [Enemella evansiae]OYO02550.1 thioredoxin [Enemella evansiae]OYO12098.1 thioredoxin [Enemella evansiae]
MAVTEVTDTTFDEMVLRSERPVLVDYWAEWCSPCKQFEPILDELSYAYGDRMDFVKLDTDDNQVTPTNYAVKGLPTVHFFVDGELVQSLQGARTKATITRAIEEYV